MVEKRPGYNGYIISPQASSAQTVVRLYMQLIYFIDPLKLVVAKPQFLCSIDCTVVTFAKEKYSTKRVDS